jgi:hypothetical protein
MFIGNSSTTTFAHYVIVNVQHVPGAHHIIPPFYVVSTTVPLHCFTSWNFIKGRLLVLMALAKI